MVAELGWCWYVLQRLYAPNARYQNTVCPRCFRQLLLGPAAADHGCINVPWWLHGWRLCLHTKQHENNERGRCTCCGRQVCWQQIPCRVHCYRRCWCWWCCCVTLVQHEWWLWYHWRFRCAWRPACASGGPAFVTVPRSDNSATSNRTHTEHRTIVPQTRWHP